MNSSKTSRRPPSDIISELPSNITENILMFLPLKDAARTSILSQTWRYKWTTVPQLVFDETFIPRLHEDPSNISLQIYYILSLHEGPIWKFTFSVPFLKSCPDIDKMIIFLSRKGIQELTIFMWDQECYELPSYIFSRLQQLKHLRLRSLVFKPPPTFKGFSKLISLELRYVDLAPSVSIGSCPLLERLALTSLANIDYFSIDAPNLKFLCLNAKIKHISIPNSPLLAILSLTSIAVVSGVRGYSIIHLINLFRCLPLIENLHMSETYLELLAIFHTEKKLPIVLNYLRILELSGISFANINDVSAAICLIRSSPNLQKLKFQVLKGPTWLEAIALKYLTQDYCDVSLKKLHEVEIEGFTGLRHDIEFIKFLLAISPELEMVRIKPTLRKVMKSRNKILKELKQCQCASQKVEFIFLGLDEMTTRHSYYGYFEMR